MSSFIYDMIISINKLLENFQGNVLNPKYEMMRADAYHQLCEITTDELLRWNFIEYT
jgi:hypothetical protein